MKIFHENDFKSAAKHLRTDLSSLDISIPLRKSYDLAAFVYANKYWTQLSPALPVSLPIPDDDSAQRCYDWLRKRQHDITQAQCLDIIERAYFRLPPDWSIDVDFEHLLSEPAPLCTSIDWSEKLNPAGIIIDPKAKIIRVSDWVNEAHPDFGFGQAYALDVHANINVKSLCQILFSDDFITLIDAIGANWYSDWDGHNHKGMLDSATQDLLIQFQELLNYTDYDRDDVCAADAYFAEFTRYFDRDGNEIDDPDDADVYRIVINDQYEITTTTDIERLAESIDEEYSSQGYKLLYLYSTLKNYFESLSTD